ncbi:polyketide synthase 3 [Aspergillus californicus]
MYEPVAIVGTSCRFPGGANTPSKLWDLLKAPKDVLKEFPPHRLSTTGIYNADGNMRGRSSVQHKSYLLEDDVRHFDNAFFHINPKEAADMDPQQRILLETVYEAFEAAGWSLTDVNGSQTSVHVGVMTDDYLLIQARDPDTLGGHAATGVSRSILANRLSYAFNLRGASLALDTACSSSLVALHLAVQGLQRGEATQAVVAGTNLLMDSTWYIMESSMHMISPESRCRMWDKDANGYARGEGCAAVVLKTLAQAIRDNDHIECIVRGTGVNSDGQADSSGITIPSPAAQTALIQQTYRDAGLDPVLDRCQYFECHGTGTQAGDPAEAQAIHDTFSGQNEDIDVLFCGSIKTVIGHLEGCAGLAGVIKASLAIQNKAIPPNMHFNQLNPKIESFCRGLKVPTSLLPWPETGVAPRRASVNSFGFGGTNAHAILESYVPSTTEVANGACDICPSDPIERKLAGPFVFSAATRGSLVSWLRQLLNYLHVNESADLDSLSNTMHSKRSVFRHRVAVATVVDREDLIEKLEDQINIISTSVDASLRSQPSSTTAEGVSILGVFTGQGAQAARMGFALLQHCRLFSESIMHCERALASIPDPPAWSLSEELAADTSESHIAEARFSQPLCTAIQIGLVDLLHACGVRFHAVVGHSSGEIGAAYAAGLLSKRDAMGISYYRGCVSNLARGDDGQPGAMLAVSMSFDDVAALCSEPQFVGRITVAASNSPSSVTLSGDKDAILEMRESLDERQVHARVLIIDTAYHSHHMRACAEPYLLRLKELGVTIQTPLASHECRWYSSVRQNTDMLDLPLGSGLEGQYWVENLTQPVLFFEAVKFSMQASTEGFTAAIEVGPHATLRGPVSQTLKQAVSPTASLPYTSCLSRSTDAVNTFLKALTDIWTLIPSSVQFAAWCRAVVGPVAPRPPLKGLPPYAWDHTQTHWRESRVAANYRLDSHPPHDLLGRLWNDAGFQQTWRNTLRLSEMPWLKGHVFQSQVLFPATGYISLAVDAAKIFVKDQPIKLVEVQDMTISRALPIGEGDEVEMLFTISSSRGSHASESVVEAEFTCCSYAHNQLDADINCEGLVRIHLGIPEPTDLAPTCISDVELTPSNVDRFYNAASEIGFAYEGAFRELHSLNKCWGHAKSAASWSNHDLLNIACTVHPALLDVAFQTGLSTILSTAEGSMASPYLPVGVKRAVINPNHEFNTNIVIEAYMTSPLVGLGQRIETDINIKSSAGQNEACEIQLEGVIFRALSEPQPSEDRNILARTSWAHDATYGLLQPAPAPAASAHSVQAETSSSSYTPEEYERVALFFLQRLAHSVSAQEMDALQPHHQKLIGSINAISARIRDSDRTFLQAEWLNDSPVIISDLLQRDSSDLDMSILALSAENMKALLKVGGSEHLSSFHYQQTTWGATCNRALAQFVVQISHTFPRTNILHLCGGGGGVAAEMVFGILDVIGDAYASYTCADASQDIVDELRERVDLASARERRLSFEVLDTDLARTGTREPYDVIIVTDIYRVREDLAGNVQRLRSFLRPGGFLICMELTGMSLRPIAMLGCSEDWWRGGGGLGVEEPAIKTGEWDTLLSNNGFSGIDSIVYDQAKSNMHGYSVFSAQALDDPMELLRSPLTSLPTMVPPTPTSVIFIGGKTSPVSRIIREGKDLLRDWTLDIQVWSCFDEIDYSQIPPQCSVISLQDLDKPLFSTPPSVKVLRNLKEVLGCTQNVLWVTSGRLVEDPYANIMIGIGRSLRYEYIHLNLQFLDFDHGEKWDAQIIMSQFLRLIFSISPSFTQGMLWVHEPEVVVRNSQIVTPRVLLDSASNEIYNAGRRRVVKTVGPTDPIEVQVREIAGGLLESVLTCSRRSFDTPDDHVRVEVKLSVALHVNTEAPCYLSYGKVDSESAALVLSATDSSVATITKHFASCRVAEECDALTLVKVASLLIASNVVSRMPSAGISLVCGASRGLARVISALATQAGRKVKFIAITKKPGKKSEPEWVFLHPQSPTHAVRKLIPHDANVVFDLSSNGAALVLPSMPPGCTAQGFNATSLSQQSVEDALNKYHTDPNILSSVPMPTLLSLPQLAQKRHIDKSERLSVVTDWSRESPVNAIIRCLEPDNLISSKKTYFLVGMAGELGQSLAYFLVRSGARYIILSSRTPKDNQRWLHDLRADGIDIRMVKMDVTDRAQVHSTVSKLRDTMPSIGGVTNAALVLEPAVFANLSAASIAKQMMPKIHGTVHLDEAFKHDQLDFFMCFGSLGTVFGNPGHAIYHAGNAFMMSLVANRKRRGLVGSILNFGMLVDVGYVARADRTAGSSGVEEWLRTDGLIALSEADFHHVILQGITAGQPQSPTCEVIMGVGTYYDKGQSPRPRWVDTAVLSHMVRRVSSVDGHINDGGASSSVSAQSRLENADTVDEAAPPLTELLSQKIKAMIHVSLDFLHPDEPLSRLGIDSINAIEIRKWLWDKLGVEISMVRILGRDSSASIIHTMAVQYLAKRPRKPKGIPNGNIAVGEEEAEKVNGKFVGISPLEVTHADQDWSSRTMDGRDSKSSPTSSVVASSPISTARPEPGLSFTRSERLSIAQAGLFYIYKFSDTRTALNVTTRWRINGPLDAERLRLAIQRTVSRHDALRTCFFAALDSSEVQQHLTSTSSFHLTRLQSTAESADVVVQKALYRIKTHEYSLETGDTLQATLVQHDARRHTLILGFHNLIIDVVSLSLILSDIARDYQSQPWSSSYYPTPATSYLDYTRQQMDDLQNGRFNSSIEYIVNHLDPAPDVLPLLPVAKVQTRQNHRAYGYHCSAIELSSDLVQSVTRISQAHGITPMQFYLATLQVFLCRLLNIDNIVIGVLHTGRDPISKFRETVGHLASILPVRFKGVLGMTFPETMKATSTTLLGSLEHADLPFALIVDKVRRVRVPSEGNMPLVQVAYNYTVDESLPTSLGECTIEVEETAFTTVYDFVLDVRRSASGGGAHILGIKCTDDFYSLSATQWIAQTFFGVLQGLIQEPGVAVQGFSLFSNSQLGIAKAAACTPAIEHSWPGSLAERFSQVAAEFPRSVAIKHGGETITYSQLRQKVELYAGILLGANTTSGSRVAVFCEPSIDLYATMMAVFWIGAVFVPLDISVPAARRNDMIKACKPHALVFNPATARDVAENHSKDTTSKVRLLNITELGQAHDQNVPPPPTIPEPAPSQPESDSHILFTSGSTGAPKGIRLHQRGIMNYAAVSSKRYSLAQVRPRVLQQTSIGFDVAFSQIYSALANGGTLVVAPFQTRMEAKTQPEESTGTEERLRALWIDVIGAAANAVSIALHSSFLAVGGNSFHLVHLQYSITREFGIKIPLSQLGQAMDLRDMAALIERGGDL